MDVNRSEISPPFIDLFIQTIGLSTDEFEYLLSHFRKEYLPKRFFYLSAGQVTRQKAYIMKGCTRTFTIDDNAREHIMFFAFEDWWIGDFESYHTGKPGLQFVQAIEDCELLCVAKTDFDKLEKELPPLQQWYEVKQKKHFYSTIQRLYDVKLLSPEQRYLNLIKKHPQIFQRIPLQFIAQYLDIEPPSLSRLRKRLSQK